MRRLTRANLLALALPSALMAGALGSQIFGHLYPCEMCHWQRWPHYTAIVIALVAFMLKPPIRNVMVALAALAILTSGAIGVYHAGVEYKFWEGITTCTSTAAGTSLADLMKGAADPLRSGAVDAVRHFARRVQCGLFNPGRHHHLGDDPKGLDHEA